MSQFQKLTTGQKRIATWRRRRNALVSKLLAGNPRMLSFEALAEANRILRGTAR
ncbi:hypothetical protein [Gemmata sp.]|uniref:hypothetical protein n=1 Tax=Gemmata sp. TaxID=1914242 RepID=UPI003F6E45C0